MYTFNISAKKYRTNNDSRLSETSVVAFHAGGGKFLDSSRGSETSIGISEPMCVAKKHILECHRILGEFKRFIVYQPARFENAE